MTLGAAPKITVPLRQVASDLIAALAGSFAANRVSATGPGVSSRVLEVETGMHSTSIAGVTRRARRASDSPAAHMLARTGLTARGVIYILIGWVALLVALGRSSREADQQGALQLLAGKPYGLASLWLLGKMSPRTRRVVELLGVIGTIARGLVFALAGVLVIDAAITHKASESGGIDKALLTLRNQPFGEFLVILAALGLAVFGIYGLCEARWRRV